MAHSLYSVAVGVQHEGSEVVRMILRPQAWLSIVAPTAKEGGRVKCSHSVPIWSAEAEVHTA